MRLTLIAALICAALPLEAQTRAWQPPQSCEIFMTVQAKGCRVSNHYICEADPVGDQWRADFDQEGLFFRSRINFETQWVESISVHDGSVQRLGPEASDPASFTDLIETGLDTFDFTLMRDDGAGSRVTGYDRLTGRSFTIDGVVLEETEFEAIEVDTFGNQLRNSRGKEYISREKRMFFAGPGQTDLGDGEWLPIDGSPVDFIFPGEPGFASPRPLYDCDPLMTEAPADPASGLLWRARYGE